MIDIYAAVTDRIIAQLETGVVPWKKPWVGVGSRCAVSFTSRKPYSLLNQLLLGDPGEYITFKQCTQSGGKVKKGAKSRIVVFWKMLNKPMVDQENKLVLDADGKQRYQMIPFLNYYNVFHIDDCDGIKTRFESEPMPNVVNPDDKADEIIALYTGKYGISLNYVKGNRAYYRMDADSITLPSAEQFVSTPEYYSTAFHELTHSTGHPSRLNRLERTSFGSESYSKEELVAEIGAASLMNEMGFETEDSFNNSVAYIQSWLKALRNDKKMIVSAAGKAEKAAKMILEA